MSLFRRSGQNHKYESAAKITRDFTRKIAHLVPLSISQRVEKVLHRLGPHKCIPLHMFQKLVESVHLTHHVMRSKPSLGKFSQGGAELDPEDAGRHRNSEKNH